MGGRALQRRLGKTMPGGSAGVCEMVESAWRSSVPRQPDSNRSQGLSEIASSRGAAPLIGYDAKLRSFGRESEHRLDEIRPVRAYDPGGPDDHGPPIGQPCRKLTGSFARAIDVERMYGVILLV